jgi:hypothetical protein
MKRRRSTIGYSWQHALVLGAVLSLAINVATRYCTVLTESAQSAHSASAHAVDAQRQHLLNDGLHWSAPPPVFVLLPPVGLCCSILTGNPAVPHRYSDESLWDRPPPAC